MSSEIQEIIPSVFISNFFGARNKTKLINAGITHIVVCAQELDCCFPESYQYLQLPLADNPSQSIKHLFDSTNEFISHALEKDDNKVLIHCAGGGSRSASMLLAYLISSVQIDDARFTLESGLTHMRSIRPV